MSRVEKQLSKLCFVRDKANLFIVVELERLIQVTWLKYFT